MLQTFWDLNRQNIRKTVDVLMGALAGVGIINKTWDPVLLALAGLALNYLWFWLDNRSKVTVAGLEAAEKIGAAVAVGNAIKAVKAAEKRKG